MKPFLKKIKSFLKKILGEKGVIFFHYLISYLANFYFRFPTRKMIVIGVTGTKGKTTTCHFIWSLLNQAGFRTGMVTTNFIDNGLEKFLNPYHMTMLGRFTLKKLLRQMVDAGCQFCVVETTSEGIKQGRHAGIDYDICIFTSLAPEHLSSHEGSFEKYKKTKGKMFAALSKSCYKKFKGKKVPKTIIVNIDDKEADYFLSFKSDLKFTFGIEKKADYQATITKTSREGVWFLVKGREYKISLLGSFNVYNALPALIIGEIFEIPHEIVKLSIEKVNYIPGRMERIEEGQDFTVLVDYAHEPKSMNSLLEEVKKLKDEKSKIILLLGAEGGGRDKSKRPAMGKIAARKADFVVVSNVDPYDDDPKQILEDIAQAAEFEGKIRGKNLFVIEDRREGIKKALSLAQKGDWVLITGKGAEQSLIIGSKHIKWDDRKVVREELKKILKK